MNKKRFAIVFVSICLMFTTCVSVSAATAGTAPNGTVSAPQGNAPQDKCKGMRGTHSGMQQLSQITGISVEDLHTKYPQKTSWQIAFQLGKLDALKSAVLADHKTMLDKWVTDGKITGEESTKMYADLQKRVNAIDGKNTVILGRPSYMPKFKGEENNH
jgi:hypothetical protein